MNEEELEILRNELSGLNDADLEHRKNDVLARLKEIEDELQNLQAAPLAANENQAQANADELERKRTQVENERNRLLEELSAIEAEIINRELPPAAPWPPEPRRRGRL